MYNLASLIIFNFLCVVIQNLKFFGIIKELKRPVCGFKVDNLVFPTRVLNQVLYVVSMSRHSTVKLP